jgi:hypothetical protein
MVYKTPNQLFHTFEADSCIAGLSFLSNEEAESFRKNVDERQNKRRTR